MKPTHIKKTEVAYMLDVTPRTVTEWQQREDDPLPRVSAGKRGVAGVYDARAVHAWSVRQALDKAGVTRSGDVLDFNTERARLTREQADAMEIKNKLARGVYGSVDVLEAVLADIAMQIKSILDSIPIRIKNSLPTLRAKEVEILKRELVRAGNAMADCRPDFGRVSAQD